jgi:hypothetical protein
MAVMTAGCRSGGDQLIGTWQGALDVSQAAPQQVKPGTTLRLVLHVQKGSDGNLTASLDSPDQGAQGLPIDTVTLKDGALHLQLNQLFASYDGQLSAGGQEISGQWKQGQLTMPLVFKKSP